MRMKPSLTFSDANTALAACLAAAAGQSLAISVAITDEAGHLVQFARMDGARGHTVERAREKARLAAMVAVPTIVIEAVQKQQASGLPPGFPGAGGVPVVIAGECAGAVGVSGSTPEIDHAIAEAAAGSISQANAAS